MNIFNQKNLQAEWEVERKPTVSVPWTDFKNSSPIEDMRSWQKSIGNMCGVFGNRIEFNWNSYVLIANSYEHRRLGFEKIVRPSEISNLLWAEAEIIITDSIIDGKIIVKSEEKYLPDWYMDLEATVIT